MNVTTTPDASILGGGIIGITTGLLLQVQGYRTRIYTARRTDDRSADAPEIASYYAAASAIPHSVVIDDLEAHTRRSQRFFEALHRAGTCGVRCQRHYEVFETSPERPAYAQAMKNFHRLPSEGALPEDVPRRPGAEALYGWSFDVFLAEMPIYLPRLYALYEAAGGTIVERHLRRQDLPHLPGEALVNCTGLGTVELFEDPRPFEVLRGLLVYLDRPVEVEPHPGISYNYTPLPEVYRTARGGAGDVYFYPRRDAWVLGGTRQRSGLPVGEMWAGETPVGPTLSIDGYRVPKPVVALNRALLLGLTGVDIAPFSKRAEAGYRFVRDPVRLEVSEEEGRVVVHNYGHGGAGVALSWSSAAEVVRLLREEVGVAPRRSRRFARSEEAGVLGALGRLSERSAIAADG